MIDYITPPQTITTFIRVTLSQKHEGKRDNVPQLMLGSIQRTQPPIGSTDNPVCSVR